jgi:hypothetical protein
VLSLPIHTGQLHLPRTEPTRDSLVGAAPGAAAAAAGKSTCRCSLQSAKAFTVRVISRVTLCCGGSGGSSSTGAAAAGSAHCKAMGKLRIVRLGFGTATEKGP